MSFHSKQMRVLLRQQIIFKNMKITSETELRCLGIYITENLKWDGRSCSIIESKAMQNSLYDENIKGNNEPLYGQKHYYSNFESCLRYAVILWGGDNESNNILYCKRRSFKELVVLDKYLRIIIFYHRLLYTCKKRYPLFKLWSFCGKKCGHP
jgi:hypothetical protein